VQVVFLEKHLAEKDNKISVITFELNILEAIEKISYLFKKNY